jgi:ATP-dependent Clp protease ATP-binding subunit ClpX
MTAITTAASGSAPPVPRSASDLFVGTAHVQGQVHARQTLAVALERQQEVAMGMWPRSHPLLAAGPTGVGKTHLIRSMCRLAGLPFVTVNATQFTDAGYIGLNLEQMFLPLIHRTVRIVVREMAEEATSKRRPVKVGKRPDSILKLPDALLDRAVQAAETGVVFLDEFDKWMLSEVHSAAQRATVQTNAESRNVGRKLQAELLKIVEGDEEEGEVWVSDSEDEIGVPFNTARCLVICGGAFVGIEKILERRMGVELTADPRIWEKTDPVDFEEYGMMPELAGRLATHVMFKPLDEAAFRAIAVEEGGVLDELDQRFRLMSARLEVDDGGLLMLIHAAQNLGIGARGLRHLIDRMFTPALFQASQKHPDAGVVRLDAGAAMSRRAVWSPE